MQTSNVTLVRSELDGAVVSVEATADGMFAFRIERETIVLGHRVVQPRCECWRTLGEAYGRYSRWVEARGGTVEALDVGRVAA